MFEAEFWVAIAFLLFIGVLGYFGAHKRLVNSIDDRRERIKAELAEARRLGVDRFYSSIAQLLGARFWPPAIRDLAEATFFEGLRQAGLPEE